VTKGPDEEINFQKKVNVLAGTCGSGKYRRGISDENQNRKTNRSFTEHMKRPAKELKEKNSLRREEEQTLIRRCGSSVNYGKKKSWVGYRTFQEV